MSDVVIRAEGLGKKYLIGHQAGRERYTALRDVMARTAKGFVRSLRDMSRGRELVDGDEIEEFWALKDVDFEIRRGEVVGIVGRNGAGKSTLLKVLSRITEPSEGRVEIRGRVASLLEVGTGFHPELTGRENIYLNGAILGMTRAEIRRKFDEIVAFAEVEKFLDTPVKRYSSGMYVRLAFAVAAHLEPEILVVDEVLAVGDAEFQKKCLGKMHDVAGQGRTVLFVSHNIPAIMSLCSAGIFLSGGRVLLTGAVSDVLEEYQAKATGESKLFGRQIDIVSDVLINGDDDGAVVLEFDVTLTGPLREPHVAFGLGDPSGVRIVTMYSETYQRLPALEAGEKMRFRMASEPVRLIPGTFLVRVSLGDQWHEIEGYDDGIVLTIPDYSPFPRRPHTKPRGHFFLTHSIKMYD